MNRQIRLECKRKLRTKPSIESVSTKEWFSCLTRPLFKKIAILFRNSSISNDESRTKKVHLHREQQRGVERVDDKSNKFGKNWTVVKDAINISWHPHCYIPLWAAGLVTPFVTPPLGHTRIDVVSARVREHPHEEKTLSVVVSWTERRAMQQA